MSSQPSRIEIDSRDVPLSWSRLSRLQFVDSVLDRKLDVDFFPSPNWTVFYEISQPITEIGPFSPLLEKIDADLWYVWPEGTFRRDVQQFVEVGLDRKEDLEPVKSYLKEDMDFEPDEVEERNKHISVMLRKPRL